MHKVWILNKKVLLYLIIPLKKYESWFEIDAFSVE